MQVPEELAAIPAGPELAAALHALPLSQVPNDHMLDVLTAQYRQLSHTQARMAAVLTELARCPGHTTPGQVVRTDEPDRYACEETRAALRWTRRSADGEHELAESVVLGMPELFAAWSAGAVDRPRVRVFDQYLTGLSTGQVDRICRVAVPRAPRLTTGHSLTCCVAWSSLSTPTPPPGGTATAYATAMSRPTPVSYAHLTLPTTPYV